MIEMRDRSSGSGHSRRSFNSNNNNGEDDEQDTLHSSQSQQQHDDMQSLLVDYPVERLQLRRYCLPRGRVRNLVCVFLVVVLFGLILNLTVSRNIPRLIPNYQPGAGHAIATWKTRKKSTRGKPSSSLSSSPLVDSKNNVTQQSSSSSSTKTIWQELESMVSWGKRTDNVDDHYQQHQQHQHVHNSNSTTTGNANTDGNKKDKNTVSLDSNDSNPSKTQNERIPTPRPTPFPTPQSKPKPTSATKTTTTKTKTTSTIPKTPYKYKPDVIPTRSNISKHFVERWCDLQSRNGHSIDWYPLKDQLWQRRAPAFLIPGAKHSGVPQLAALLAQHPQIAAPTPYDVNFFFQAQRYVHANNEQTHVYAARQRLYAHHFYPTSRLQQDPNVISFDATPGYLLYSALTPRRIFCVAPWVKLVILLQDPIERLVSHYLAARQKGLRLDFDVWIRKDIRLLQHHGFWNATPGSPEEDVAWYEYTRSTTEGVVGRSLYDIQLRHWMQAVLALGKRPSRSVLLVRNADFVQQPTGYLRRILQFVGVNATAGLNGVVQQSSPTRTSKQHQALTLEIPSRNATQTVLTPEFRQELLELFRPYQKRFPNTLKKFGMAWAQPL